MAALKEKQRRHGRPHSITRRAIQAIAEARVFDPDIVLLDIGLPSLDGYAVARQLRTMSDARLVALTGYGTLSQEAPFDEHLLKPVEPHTLRDLLR